MAIPKQMPKDVQIQMMSGSLADIMDAIGLRQFVTLKPKTSASGVEPESHIITIFVIDETGPAVGPMDFNCFPSVYDAWVKMTHLEYRICINLHTDNTSTVRIEKQDSGGQWDAFLSKDLESSRGGYVLSEAKELILRFPGSFNRRCQDSIN